jgi:hypothetical protein
MKRRRWVFGAAALVGVVALVAPAVGQGTTKPASLAWSLSRGGAALTSYDFGAVDGGVRVVRGFRLGNSRLTKSGKLAISLFGYSSRFSITSDKCKRKSIGRNVSCWVGVAYRPLGAGTSDTAWLRATGEGGAAATLSLSGSSAGPSGHVYWANSYDGTVFKVPRGGGGVANLVPSFGNSYAPQAVAVDSTHFYLVNFFFGTVDEFGLNGDYPTTLANGQYYAISVAVNGTHLYWVDETGANGGTVNEVPVGGGTVTTLASGQDDPRSVAVDGTHVYWVNFGDGTVNEVPIGGGSVTTLATGQSEPVSVAVAGTHVYWVNIADGTVNEVPVGGGPVTTLASGQNGPNSVAADGTHVYWVNEFDGTVNDVPTGGGAVTTLASGQDVAGSVAVDATHVYWGNLGTVNKVRLGGGPVTTLATGQNYPKSVAVGP